MPGCRPLDRGAGPNPGPDWREPRAVEGPAGAKAQNMAAGCPLNSAAKSTAIVVQRMMTITLTPEQEAWFKTHVARGQFASVEDAARQLIDERIAERAAEESDDLAWAKPDVDEARAAVARGEYVTLEEHRDHNAALLASLKG